LVGDSPRGPRTARAVFEVALIEIDHGDPERGWAALQAAVESYPDHGSARHGLKLLLSHMTERDGEEAVRAYLQRQLPRFRSTEAEQQAEYEIARSLERSGRLEEAREAFVAAARRHPYPSGNLTDDAWWRASLVDEQLDRPERAISDLRRLLEPVEEDITGGRYERPRFPYAQMRIAELYRDKLGDETAARREFRRVHERHGESTIADDALWQEALLAHAAGAGEDTCDVAQLLGGSYPASRYVRCLPMLCPAATNDPPKPPCPPYLQRMVRGATDRAGQGKPEP